MAPIESQNTTSEPPARRPLRMEQIVNLVVLLAAAGITVYNVYDRFVARSGPIAQPRSVANLQGRQFALPKPYRGGDRVTIALLLSRGCHFCSESAPFYRRLASIRTRTPSEFSMVAVFPNAEGGDVGAEYLKTNGVHVNEVQAASFPNLGVSGTPTLLVLDGSHKVTAAWSGLLGPGGETKVIETIAKLCPNCSLP